MENLIRAALRGDEKELIRALLAFSRADGILWLMTGDSLVSLAASGPISRQALSESAYLLVDTLQHRHGMPEAAPYLEVDIDESMADSGLGPPAWWMTAPVMDGEACLGGLMLFAGRQLNLTPTEIEPFALALAVAFRLRRGERRFDRVSDRLAQLAEMEDVIGAGEGLDKTTSQILELALRVSGAEVGALIHRTRDGSPQVTGLTPEVLGSLKFNSGQDLLERALSLREETLYAGETLRRELDLAAATMVVENLAIRPLIHERRHIGAMVLINRPAALLTDDTARGALGVMARLAAAMIVAEQEYEDRLEQERTRQELKAACLIQQSLLPKETFTRDGVIARGRSQPSRSVGGDFFDIFPLDDRRFGVLLADVSGMGIPASLLMAVARSYMRVTALQHPDSPAQALRRLNRLLCGEIADNRFITANYVIFEPAAGTALFANAGHHPAFLVSPSGVVSEVDADGMPLGIFPDTEYTESKFTYTAEMMLVLYTDGLADLRNALGEPLGRQRLKEYVTGTNLLSPEELLQMLWEKTMAYAGAHEPPDDWTAVVVQCRK